MGCSPGVKIRKKAVTLWQTETDLPLHGPSGTESCLARAAGFLGPSGAEGTDQMRLLCSDIAGVPAKENREGRDLSLESSRTYH